MKRDDKLDVSAKSAFARAAARATLSIDDALVRLSVGVEDLGDLRNDLAQALAAI